MKYSNNYKYCNFCVYAVYAVHQSAGTAMLSLHSPHTTREEGTDCTWFDLPRHTCTGAVGSDNLPVLSGEDWLGFT